MADVLFGLHPQHWVVGGHLQPRREEGVAAEAVDSATLHHPLLRRDELRELTDKDLHYPVSDMTASVGTFNTSTLSGANSIITPGAGGSRFDTITLNGLHDGSQAYSDVVFYFAVSAVNNALSSVTVTGATGTLEFAGTAGSGFVGTLAASNPAAGQLTLVKWSGSLSAAETSLTLNLGGDKAGISTIAYVIPEPSSMGLLGLSALGLMVRRRR